MTLEEMIGQFKAYTEYPNQDTFVISNQTCQDIVKYLTGQEPKMGHWIKIPLTKAGQSYSHECSECGRKILVMKKNLSEFPYCHCGAKMTESEE